MTRTEILAHYKKFFEMEHLMISEYDELMIDWAEDVVKNCTIPHNKPFIIPDVSVSLPSDAEIEAEIWEEFPAPLCGLDKETMSDEYVRYLNAVHWAKFGRDFKGNER